MPHSRRGDGCVGTAALREVKDYIHHSLPCATSGHEPVAFNFVDQKIPKVYRITDCKVAFSTSGERNNAKFRTV